MSVQWIITRKTNCAIHCRNLSSGLHFPPFLNNWDRLLYTFSISVVVSLVVLDAKFVDFFYGCHKDVLLHW